MRTKAIIHLDHFMHNLSAVKARVGKGRLICVPVKADGYGHGAVKIAQKSLETGVFCLGVATTGEGMELRKEGIKAPILLFSQPHFREIPVIFDGRLIPFISDSEFINAIGDEAKKRKTRLQVHLKIDTGMGRAGCMPEEAPVLAAQIASTHGLEYAGTATHLAVSDSADPADIAYTKTQLTRFNEAVEKIKAAGIDPGIVHAANSGAVILHPDSWYDMVRPGIFLYGYKTVMETSGFPFEPLPVQPVMELRSTVALIKRVKKGTAISYGRTWTAEQDTNIAVLPVGYADGFPRLASNRWQVEIGGRVYPLAGRICMDQCCVNLGQETSVRRWDEAVVFGGTASLPQQHDAGALAEIAGTIPYEITCGISKRVIREYV